MELQRAEHTTERLSLSFYGTNIYSVRIMSQALCWAGDMVKWRVPVLSGEADSMGSQCSCGTGRRAGRA